VVDGAGRAEAGVGADARPDPVVDQLEIAARELEQAALPPAVDRGSARSAAELVSWASTPSKSRVDEE